MKDAKKILQRIKLIVNQSDPTARVYLYGSRARGTAQPDSDAGGKTPMTDNSTGDYVKFRINRAPDVCRNQGFNKFIQLLYF